MRRSIPLMILVGLLALESPVYAQSEMVGTLRSQLRPGDVIKIEIWREPDMSGEYIIDEAGVVIFPRVGEYSVLADTPETLAERLTADYRRFLRNPSITVTVLHRIRIFGAVNSPGLHLVDATITVADALALAGGATPLGNPDRVRVLRDGEDIDVNLSQDLLIADSPLRSGDQLFVPERSWISRNSGVVAAGIGAAVSLLVALVIR